MEGRQWGGMNNVYWQVVDQVEGLGGKAVERHE